MHAYLSPFHRGQVKEGKEEKTFLIISPGQTPYPLPVFNSHTTQGNMFNYTWTICTMKEYMVSDTSYITNNITQC